MTTPEHAYQRLAHAAREAAAPTANRLDRYTIVRLLGRGARGCVYEAYDKDLKRRVALKVLNEDSEYAHSQIVAQLRHPNIVAIYDVASTTDDQGISRHTIAMEFVAGGTLAEVIRAKTLPRNTLLKMLEDVARAVHAAHEKGILHRDLKPGNILVDVSSSQSPVSSKNPPLLATGNWQLGTPRAVITDFGLTPAKRLETPNYMAPEQVLGRTQEVDARTDIYALGVILYELVTGDLPFHGPSYAEVQRQILHAPPPRLSSRIPVERDLELVCLKAMHRDRSERYATAREFADDLARFLKGDAILAHPPSLRYRINQGVRRHRLAVVITVLGLTAIGTAGYFLLRSLR